MRRHRPTPPTITDLLDALGQTETDLVVLTGDFMDRPGDEKTAMESLREVVAACHARLGIAGVVGNHDSGPLRERLAEVRGVRWLTRGAPVWDVMPELRLIGSEEPEDLLASVLASPAPGSGAMTIGLIHYPSEIYTAADLGIPLVLAGHTHAGQFRVSPRLAPHTSSDLPADLATGVLRLRQTLCAVSRGLGQAVIEARINCPPQAPVYVLRRGELPRIGAADFNRLTMQEAW
ncbi:MAG: metallophosphoesterase [Phycisphaerales bacterium]|nr:metallophosphoesterase [Phycisphaerales bacterium]